METDRVAELLVFEHDGVTFAIGAADVESVIAWREPVPLPRSAAGLRGVIQDRGRVVAVLTRPMLTSHVAERGAIPTRILVCPTSRGYVGFPATRARLVGEVSFRGEPESGAVIDSSVGALTYVTPERVVATLLGE